ncbi:hypothetical protein ABK040_005714 [Willaertia magna]
MLKKHSLLKKEFKACDYVINTLLSATKGHIKRNPSFLDVPIYSSVPETFYNKQIFKKYFHINIPNEVHPARLATLEYEADISNNPERKAAYLQALIENGNYQQVVKIVDSGKYPKDHPSIYQAYTTALQKIAVPQQSFNPFGGQPGYSNQQQQPNIHQQQQYPNYSTNEQAYYSSQPSIALLSTDKPLPVIVTNPLGGSGKETSGFWSLLDKLGKIAVIVGVIASCLFIYVVISPSLGDSENKQGKQGGGLGSMFGTTSYKPTTNIQTRFSDVKGIDECREELEEIVEFLKNGDKFNRLGGKLPKGVLLVGKPGVGKTLLAKAIAGEAGVPFYFCTGSEFDEMFVGVGARRIRDLFAAARKSAPCIIFIDEIDSLGGRRSARDPFYSKQSLNQLLAEMDGFKSSEGVVVIGATNLLDSLDRALIRPGRFDKHIEVPLPDLKGRKDILELYFKKVPANPTVNIDTVAKKTTGFTGADLENLVNLAAIRACTKNKDNVSNDDMDYAFDRIVMGIARSSSVNVMDDRDKEITAIHECGHALVVLINQKMSNQLNKDNLHKITIIPRGGALGFTASLPEREVKHMTKQQYIQIIEKALGGVVAEEIMYGKDNVTSGCTSDLEQATKIARAMVTKFGMSRLGLVDYTEESLSVYQKPPEFSPETKRLIDQEIQGIINDAYDRVKKMLKENETDLKRLAKELVKYETLSGKEVMDILDGKEIKRVGGEVEF